MSYLISYVIYVLVVVLPFWMLLPRFGIPAVASLLAMIPVLAIGLVWAMAFRDTVNLPGDPGQGEG